MIETKRKKELKKEFSNGKTVGKALVQFYIERRKCHQEPKFKTALTVEEVNYLRSTVKTHKDKILFYPYYSLYKLLRQFVRWIEHYEHVFYHGLFRGLAIIQTPDYDIQIYHYIMSQTPTNTNAIEEAKTEYINSLVPVVDTLIVNWDNLMAHALKKLYSYHLRLKKIQELTKYDLTPLLPDMKHHEKEVKDLQKIAECFRENLDKFINNNEFEVNNDVLKTLDDFIQIDINNLKPTGAFKEENIQQAIEAINAIKEVTV